MIKTNLWMASCNGDETTVLKLIKDNVDINYLNENGDSSIHIALYKRQINIVKYLITAGANLNILNNKNMSPLDIAFKNNYTYMNFVHMLVNAGAKKLNVNKAYNRITPLWRAIYHSDFDIIKMLIENGANVNYINSNGNSPLEYAVKHQNTILSSILIKAGAKIDIYNKDKHGNTILHYAVKNIKFKNIVSEWIIKGGNINSQNNYGKIPLWNAVYNNTYEIISMLIENGADVNLYKTGEHVNSLSVEKRNKITYSSLHSKQYYYNFHNDYTPLLIYAMRYNKYELFNILLKHNIEINNHKTRQDWPALLFACCYGKTRFVKMLIESGNVDVNECNISSGVSPLLSGCYKLEIVKILIANGADVNCADKEGVTPLLWVLEEDWSDMNECNAIVAMLIIAGADVNIVSDVGTTPLYFAVKQRNMTAFQLLIGAGADINVANTNDINIFDVCTSKAIKKYLRIIFIKDIIKIKLEHIGKINFVCRLIKNQKTSYFQHQSIYDCVLDNLLENIHNYI
jgi:ankyrin repeat protein